MGLTFKKFPELFRKKGAIILIPALALVLILMSFIYIIVKQNSNTIIRFNEQIRGLTKTSTIYIANNYDLYGSPLTIKYQNIVKDFLESNNEVSKFQIFNTDGLVVFDSNHINNPTSSSVGDRILNLSRNDEITTLMTNNKINVLVSPYFEEWGTHKYSILLYPSYTLVDSQNRQFDIQASIITILLVFAIVAMVLLFLLTERYKVHKEEAERLAVLDKQRQEFMMLVAHNLRTPLTIIEGYLSMLSEAQMPAGLKKLVDPIGDATVNLNQLVERILTITAILGQPDVKISKENLKLQDVILDVIKGYQSKIDQKKLSVNLTFEPEDLAIFANKRYTKMIFTALIDNAIKFNKPGGEIRISGKDEANNAILTISDTGIGIAEKAQKEIFAQFSRADVDDGKYIYNYEGSGLGLYATKVLVESFGGKIWFESAEDRGATFYVSLPVAKPIA